MLETCLLHIPNVIILADKYGEAEMKIEKMSIDNICGIKHLDLLFNEGLNLICGENGVGKTTILKAIAHQFINGQDSFIKKHYGTEKGIVNIWLKDNDNPLKYEVTEFVPGDVKSNSIDYKKGNALIYFHSTRKIDYYKIDALPASKNCETDNAPLHASQMLINGVDNKIKSWFVNRFVFSNIKNSLNIIQQENLKLSKSIFNSLDESLSVKTVKPDFEIILQRKNKEIFFEMLSDGYKSCIFILLGIVKEIEYRFPSIEAVNFDGIIMIDEIDIHLHPQWQAKLVKVLKETFPKAQIIATTHSPSVLQNAKSNELIPLYRDNEDNICIKELHLGEYGLQGWTLEEILEDVMGMSSTNSELYMQVMKGFDKAMYEENISLIKENYNLLDKMLHPNSTLRTLLKIQMAGMEE